ncbi:MAG: hypothetical protein ACKVOH_04235 [Chlamydiales bacterium]
MASLCAEEDDNPAVINGEVYYIRSTPKAGTHLLRKALYLMSGSAINVTHLRRPNMIEKAKRHKTVLQIRDPRDIFISLIEHIDKAILAETREVNPIRDPMIIKRWLFPYWLSLSFEEKLTLLLLERENKIPFRSERLRSNCEKATELLQMQESQPFIIRFEDLIGSQGGGSRERQEKTLQNLAAFLNIPLSSVHLQYVADNLWGLSDPARRIPLEKTFHQGRIGRWKEKFTAEQCKIFKSKWNQYLVAWGYETSEEW